LRTHIEEQCREAGFEADISCLQRFLAGVSGAPNGHVADLVLRTACAEVP